MVGVRVTELFCALVERLRGSAVCGVVLGSLLLGPPALAQAGNDGVLKRGDAVVTGFSGVMMQPGPARAGANLLDRVFIDPEGIVLQIFDLSNMLGPPAAQLVDPPRTLKVNAGQIGQVFGVTLDDGGTSGSRAPNIYATATSVFGLQIVAPGPDGTLSRLKRGRRDATWMDSQFGFGAGGSPGSVWKVDGRTGEISLFATIALEGTANSGPALGNIAFDPGTRQLFVSDLETGMIHRLSLEGFDLGWFDHGTQGRPKGGLEPVAFDPTKRLDITSEAFDSEDPATWHYADKRRMVWGLAVRNGRLYYGVAEGPQIWSVGINDDSSFADDARLELKVSGTPNGNPISDITFDREGLMYLAQRGEFAASYDYSVLAKPKQSVVLRYRSKSAGNVQTVAKIEWVPVVEEYAIGFPLDYRNTNGGLALGYGYNEQGRYAACERTLWSTGEQLRVSQSLAAELAKGGPAIVNGLQGVDKDIVRPQNEPPFRTYYIDFDGRFEDPEVAGHLGDIAIWTVCDERAAARQPQEVAAAQPQPPPQPPETPPAAPPPSITIEKECDDYVIGGLLSCSITITNNGSVPYDDPITIDDAAVNLTGGGQLTLVSVSSDGSDWSCSDLPADRLQCSLPGGQLQPGQSTTLDVTMDVSILIGTDSWGYRNCVVLDPVDEDPTTDTPADNKVCAIGGTKITIVDVYDPAAEPGGVAIVDVVKTGPESCDDGATCTFQITVTNRGNAPFDGELTLGEGMRVRGTPVSSTSLVSVKPALGCSAAPTALPFLCTAGMTLSPGESRTIQITVQLPPGLAAPGETVDALNCFVVINPNLTPVGQTGTAPGLPFTPAAGGPGYSCWPFKIKKPPVASSTTTSASIPLPPLEVPCPSTMVRVGTQCSCPEHSRWNGNRCEPKGPVTALIPSPPITLQACPPTMVRVGTQCGCAEHSRWNGHRCEPKGPVTAPIPSPPIALQSCPPTMVRVGTQCGCAEHSRWNGNRCEPKGSVTALIPSPPITLQGCPPTMVRVGTQCGCAEHSRWNGHRCEPKGPVIALAPPPDIRHGPRPPTITRSCPGGMIWNGHRCQSVKHGPRVRTNPPAITHRHKPVTMRVHRKPVMKRIHTAPRHHSRRVVKRMGHR